MSVTVICLGTKKMDGISGSGLGSISRLREVIKRQRKDSDPGVDAPDFDFKYTDSDTYLHELAELYAYTEVPEFENTKLQFEASLEEAFRDSPSTLHRPPRWHKISLAGRRAYIMGLIDRFEVHSSQDRLLAVRQLLYLAHGNYRPDMAESELCRAARQNVFLLLQAGAFEATVELLSLEMEQGRGVYESSKTNINIANNHNLRTCLSLLYVIVETASREERDDQPDWREARALLLEQLSNPIVGDDTLITMLFNMLLSFCSGAMPHYPVKKILLLLWKCVLTTLGGVETLKELKKEARMAAGLQPVYPDLQPSRPLVLPTAAFDPRGQASGSSATGSVPSSSLSLSEMAGKYRGNLSSMSSDADAPNLGPMKMLEFRPKARQKDVEAFVEACQSKFCCYDVVVDGGRSGRIGGDQAGGGEVVLDDRRFSGLPEPIRESIKVLYDHIYIPLSDIHTAQEAALEAEKATPTQLNPSSRVPDLSPPPPAKWVNLPAETLYRSLLPNLSQYMIALLKVLLAAAPTSRPRNDSLNILVDVLPPEPPSSIVESTQITLDISRHKEIIVKAVSAILFLLLKHFKLNHAYQFEFLGQQLLFANCIPLILKFFNQNVAQYVASRNNYPALNFPSCVLHPMGEGGPDPATMAMIGTNSSGAGVEGSMSGNATTDQGYCWRNLFSCINLVRVLQKLTKWKHCRTVMMVVFRSAPILKRTLKVRHSLFQLYVLKLLKAQTKYLGRNWRRSNMKTVSAIYHRVRHHLHDDWAYGNDLAAKPCDFQHEELALRSAIELFNNRHYFSEQGWGGGGGGGNGGIGNEGGGGGQVEMLEKEVELSKNFMEHYEEWVDLEVFLMPKDWDNVLKMPSAFMELKLVDF